MTSRQLVYDTLEFKNFSRVPRQVWVLPWAQTTYPDEYAKLIAEFPMDLEWCEGIYNTPLETQGDKYSIGQYVDEWGCVFENRMDGVIGEVKKQLIAGEDWEQTDFMRIPNELLDLDVAAINAKCAGTQKFTIGATSVRIFERLQFLRGTEELLIDLAMMPEGMFDVIGKVHAFFCEEIKAWCKTNVDAVFIQDDWGSQLNLLINPKTWAEIFKPLYREYVQIIHQSGKKAFMHSDGNIISIIPHLIDIGVDALNSQIFCMGVENLAKFKGQITFWGEVDRQNLLPFGTLNEVEQAVTLVKNSLWQNGGCIAQCDFGIGVNPQNVFQVFKTWQNLV